MLWYTELGIKRWECKGIYLKPLFHRPIVVATKQASLLPLSACHEGTLDKHARKLAPPPHDLSTLSPSQAGDVLAAAAQPPNLDFEEDKRAQMTYAAKPLRGRCLWLVESSQSSISWHANECGAAAWQLDAAVSRDPTASAGALKRAERGKAEEK